MASNLQKKPFLDYQAQIKYLKQKQLTINNEVSATSQDSIPDLTAHKKLRISKINSRYQQGKSDLFATVISLKYLLDVADFRQFYYELKKVIKKYNPSEKTMKLMGFPTNWMSILRIKVY